MTKKYAIIETIQSFKHIYAFEMKDGETPEMYAKYVHREVAEELMQDHIGESVIGIRQCKLPEVVKIARDYCYDTWSEEDIDKRLVNRYEDD